MKKLTMCLKNKIVPIINVLYNHSLKKYEHVINVCVILSFSGMIYTTCHAVSIEHCVLQHFLAFWGALMAMYVNFINFLVSFTIVVHFIRQFMRLSQVKLVCSQIVFV